MKRRLGNMMRLTTLNSGWSHTETQYILNDQINVLNEQASRSTHDLAINMVSMLAFDKKLSNSYVREAIATVMNNDVKALVAFRVG